MIHGDPVFSNVLLTDAPAVVLLDMRGELGDPALAPVPDALLPLAKLREYIGPTGLDAVRDLEPGQVSPPIPTAGGVQILELAEREDARTPSLRTIRDLVEAEWSRREAEAALRRYLEELRRRARIRVSPELE